jgi:ABC-type polysaccharide/polyol phosphate export permease
VDVQLMAASGVRAHVRSLYAYRELVVMLTLRELRTRYRRSVLGWGWSMVNPLVMTLTYGVVFSIFLTIRPEPGNPSGIRVFAFYLLSGLLPWNAFAAGLSSSVGALLGGAGMMQKVSFPREAIVISAVLAMMISLCIELGVLCVALSVFGHPPLLGVFVAFIATICLAMFTAGLSLFFSAANLRYRDVGHILGVVLTVWFYLTPIVYPASRIPVDWKLGGTRVPLRTLIGLNPMARFVQVYRNALYDQTLPGANTSIVLLLTSSVVLLLGYRYFIRRAPRFVEEL